MKSILRLFLTSQKQRFGQAQKTSGFTLIEVLVAMILATLVIGPLLGFMINILDTDRREQAKSNSEQEIRAALDYIAQDLQQAVYIYDADGMAAIKSQLPLPATTDKVPVLVFWKRELKKKIVPVTTNNCTNPDTCDDAFVYSLVSYYLIKDTDPTWSESARIGRFQIQDGIRSNSGTVRTEPVYNYDGVANTLTQNGTQQVKYLGSASNPGKNGWPDAGFLPFNLTFSGDLTNKMKWWRKHPSEGYSNQIVPLVDYIDQSKYTDPDKTTFLKPANPCRTKVINNPDGTTTTVNIKPVPEESTTPSELKTGSFYACVDSSTNSAQIFIRGNALARIRDGATWSKDSVYFPSASIQVQGRSFLDTK
ncbi:hormogonium polysaccharide secretion pseudopilin HpsC [Coleofasciculus sp. FACHB-SPT9]|uniref:hormogonium polysaccharide secretion pseudopilin HpsC n=1 Tax=Cyanophyceae TaxID=3028117 RepID=UPI001682EE16|nr:hormogonium polysaccharide secretion pseudopilin HpsC [Coleofasciculus sp. FACHB-SPT9]MBD1890133.1 prepilin-type N-terminal cleavage/methylation domain-containing protein [Coleofasciculus sp. FACHB-SPT9]